MTLFTFIHRLEVIINATSGGYKIANNYNNRRENFVGLTGNRTVTLTFDLQRPTHCIETTTCAPEDNVLIDVGPEIDKEVRLQYYQHRDLCLSHKSVLCAGKMS